jgi:hypothetical protein
LNELCKFPGESAKRYALQAKLQTLYLVIALLGCGNAQGQFVPPFFVFPGARMRQELLEGKSTGASGDVTESGAKHKKIKSINLYFVLYGNKTNLSMV